jgi:hypothetical protein
MGKTITTILKFDAAQHKWWNKPLVKFAGSYLPAELAVLSLEIHPGERGAWMNSRGTASGVVDLTCEQKNGEAEYSARRELLPGFVSETIRSLYQKAKVRKGCPDLVIWTVEAQQLRFIEVKCPHWDKSTREQELFMKAAESFGISTKIVEWEFSESTA